MPAEFGNGTGSRPVEGNSSSIGGWIVWPPVARDKKWRLTKYFDVTANPDSKSS